MLHLAIAAFLAASGANVATSMQAIGAHPDRTREWSPIFRPFVDHPWLYGATTVSGAGGTAVLLDRFGRTHPKIAVTIALVGAAGASAAAVHNAKLARR